MVSIFLKKRDEQDTGFQQSEKIELGPPTYDKIQRRPAALSSERDAFAEKGNGKGKTPQLSVNDLDIANRLPHNRFLQVTVSEFDRAKIDMGARTINIKEKYLHPQFDQFTLKNDICLLELEDSINFHVFAQPVCLPDKGSRIDKIPLGKGPLCYVAGWGRIGEMENTARILQETQVPIVNNTIKSIVVPDEVKTTLPPTTTTTERSPVVGLTKMHSFCGNPKENYKIAKNVQVGCNEIGCKFFCPKRMKPSVSKVGCNKKWKNFVPKRLKRPIFCMEEKKKSIKEEVIQRGNEMTSCGNVTKKFKLPESINIDCKNDKCDLTCENPNMEPTLSQIKCQRSTGKSKKGKFIPRRARVNCVVKKNSKAMRSMGSTAEETCGYLPVQIAQPASYFCEDMSCHFYCPDNLTPNHAKITCNPWKRSWWPKRFSVFCE
ncbi:Oidioi.mRNA.OKI2018_I69.chr1.g727.t1.cds [Oikopleura dioica]|uniref:Oidioi.mRNA.OKI2018_I69.chr1.g727.t1.cds n=1 Tax=Oikopleura dioica TaxID=34765 RepID=A0ABN7SQX2_OIKDI|nr:Oidioi.mRNA.OKI2018_I69.chr1.g727.t1.cds [Oikopleura dioica]